MWIDSRLGEGTSTGIEIPEQTGVTPERTPDHEGALVGTESL
jgi:hypothetical protein